MITSPAPIAFRSENGAAGGLAGAPPAVRGSPSSADRAEKQAAGQNCELDQLHLTLDSLRFWRHTSLVECAGGDRPTPPAETKPPWLRPKIFMIGNHLRPARPYDRRTKTLPRKRKLGQTGSLVRMNGGPDKDRGQERKDVRLQERHEQLQQAQEDHADDAGGRHQEERTGSTAWSSG